MHKRLPLLEGSELRILQKKDAKPLFDLILANRKYLMTWFDWARQTKSLEDTKLFIEESLRKTQINRAFDAGIWKDNSLCGMIGFHEIDWRHRFVEVGYWLAEDCQGHGLVTRALQIMMLYAFRQFNLNRVEVICAVNNLKSRAVAERIGCVLEGTQRDGQMLAGRPIDEAVYSFLQRDYIADPALLERPCASRKSVQVEERAAC